MPAKGTVSETIVACGFSSYLTHFNGSALLFLVTRFFFLCLGVNLYWFLSFLLHFSAA